MNAVLKIKNLDPLPPCSVESEQCAIASAMLDAGAFRALRAMLPGAEAFYQPDHDVIWRALCAMADRGSEIDAVLLFAELQTRGEVEQAGGAAYLGDILASVPSAGHFEHYGRVVLEKWRMRRLIQLSGKIASAASEPYEFGHIESERIIDDSSQALARLAMVGDKPRTQRIDEVVKTTTDAIVSGGVPGVMTGITDIDEKTGGIGDSEMWAIAARPSMGKSTLARQIAANMAMAGIPIAYYSLEESKEKIARNLLAMLASVVNQNVRHPDRLDNAQLQRLAEAERRLANAPMFINDRLRSTRDLRADIADQVARNKIRGAFFDYLQLIDAPGRDEVERVSNASRFLCEVKKDFNVFIIACAQLNRGLESREDKRPALLDLRGSGQIEQDADGIFFIYREDYYHRDDPNYYKTGVAEFITGKMRDGDRGGPPVMLHANLQYQRFDRRQQAQDIPW